MIINPILKKTVVNSVESECIAVDLDMKNGDQVLTSTKEGYLLSKVTVKKPTAMIPGNIREGVELGGVVGIYQTPAKPLYVVENGDYLPPAGEHFSSVHINLEVEGPSGTKRITENGTYDVMGYASAEIDVETPTEELTVTENGDYTPPAGKHYSKVTVNVEAEGGSDSGEPENLSAELTEQDGLLTSIESMLKLATVTLSVSFAEEYEDWENSDGEMIYKPFSVTGSYTVDGDHTVYFEKAPSLEIPCSVGSVIEIVYDRWYEYGRAYRDAQGVNVEEFYVETEEEQNACFRITVTESDASVTLYNCYG